MKISSIKRHEKNVEEKLDADQEKSRLIATPPTRAQSFSGLLARTIPRVFARLPSHRSKTEPIAISAFCVTPAKSLSVAQTPLALSPSEYSRLASAYGAETVLHRVEHDVFSDVAALERQLAHEHRVDMSAKEYASLDPSAIPNGWTIDDKFIYHDHGLVELRTILRGSAGECGKVVRGFDGHTLHLNKAYKSSLPTRLANVPGFERPVATVNYMTARACKLLGVTTENLREIKINRLQHRPTLAHLDWLQQKYPGKPLSTLIGHTTWARSYVRQTAANIGYSLQKDPQITLEGSQEWEAAHPNASHRDWNYIGAETQRLAIKHFTGQTIAKVDDPSIDWKASATHAVENFKIQRCLGLDNDEASALRNQIDEAIAKQSAQIERGDLELARRYGLSNNYTPTHLNFDVTFRTQPGVEKAI